MTHSELRVVASSVDDPTRLTASIPLATLIEEANKFLPIRDVYAQVASPSGFTLLRLGFLQVVFSPLDESPADSSSGEPPSDMQPAPNSSPTGQPEKGQQSIEPDVKEGKGGFFRRLIGNSEPGPQDNIEGGPEAG